MFYFPPSCHGKSPTMPSVVPSWKPLSTGIVSASYSSPAQPSILCMESAGPWVMWLWRQHGHGERTHTGIHRRVWVKEHKRESEKELYLVIWARSFFKLTNELAKISTLLMGSTSCQIIVPQARLTGKQLPSATMTSTAHVPISSLSTTIQDQWGRNS